MFSKIQSSKLDKSKVKKILACSQCSKIVNKPRTLRCYHTFCQACMETLPKKTNENDISGLSCSVCNSFCNDTKIHANCLINELLDMYQVSEKGESGQCQQCTKKKSDWTCTDCKMNLCDECHELHARVPLLKNHRVLPLKAEKNAVMLIDRVVFCQIHDDEPVKLNCIECSLPLCIKCKVTEHENHKTETVEKAIDRFLPLVQKDCIQVRDKINELESIHANLVQKVSETKQVYCQCRLEADEKLKRLCNNAKDQHKALSEDMLIKEEEEIAKLEIAKEKLDFKLKEYRNTCNWADTSMQLAKGTSLLAEVEGGLYNNLHDMATNKFKLSAVIDHPKLESNTEQEQMENMIGKIKYDKVVAVSSNVCDNGKHCKIQLTEIFDKPLQKKLDIQVSHACYRIAIINGDVWVPIPRQNKIEVYKIDGTLEKSIPIPRPRSVAQLSNGNIVIASSSGLFVIDNEYQITQEICKQNFCDIDVIDDAIAALNCSTSQYEKYTNDGSEWKINSSYSLYRGVVGTGTIINMKNYFYTTSADCLQKYSKNQLLSEMGINGSSTGTTNPGYVYTPYLCAVDDVGNVLVADYNNARVQILSEYEWKVVCHGNILESRNPYDCKVDDKGNIWVITGQNKLMCFG